jgi:hypothetical protein
LPAYGTKLLERVVERKISAAVPVKLLGASVGRPAGRVAERGRFFHSLLPEEPRLSWCVAITMPLARIRWLGPSAQIPMLNPLQ